MPTNTAAWLNQKHGRFQIGEAPYPSPSADQIVIRNRAVAMNPLEWIIQVEGNLFYGWLDYPTVLGSDTAGEVVEVGSGVTRFRVGDRVLGHAVGTDKDTKSAAEGTFQEYTLVLERLAAPLPEALSFEEAATLPLAVSTASCALFESAWLGLRLPSANPTPTGQTVLVWGGSTSVGSQAIQLAVAAGYEVITTASPRNFESLTNLGAALVFDYNSPTVEQDIIAALSSRTLAGAVSFGTTGAPACVRIAGASKGNRFVAIGTPPVSFEALADGGFATRVRVTCEADRVEHRAAGLRPNQGREAEVHLRHRSEEHRRQSGHLPRLPPRCPRGRQLQDRSAAQCRRPGTRRHPGCPRHPAPWSLRPEDRRHPQGR